MPVYESVKQLRAAPPSQRQHFMTRLDKESAFHELQHAAKGGQIGRTWWGRSINYTNIDQINAIAALSKLADMRALRWLEHIYEPIPCIDLMDITEQDIGRHTKQLKIFDYMRAPAYFRAELNTTVIAGQCINGAQYLRTPEQVESEFNSLREQNQTHRLFREALLSLRLDLGQPIPDQELEALYHL